MDWGLVARLFVFGFIGALIGLRFSRARRLRADRWAKYGIGVWQAHGQVGSLPNNPNCELQNQQDH
jgi:hypothetical protein